MQRWVFHPATAAAPDTHGKGSTVAEGHGQALLRLSTLREHVGQRVRAYLATPSTDAERQQEQGRLGSPDGRVRLDPRTAPESARFRLSDDGLELTGLEHFTSMLADTCVADGAWMCVMCLLPSRPTPSGHVRAGGGIARVCCRVVCGAVSACALRAACEAVCIWVSCGWAGGCYSSGATDFQVEGAMCCVSGIPTVPHRYGWRAGVPTWRCIMCVGVGALAVEPALYLEGWCLGVG